MVTLNILSDLHLELVTHPDTKIKNLIPTNLADILILAGDIGNPFSPNYKLLLDQMAPLYKIIFIISGNHEYYQKPVKIYDNNKFVRIDTYDINKVNDKIIELTKNYQNVFFLQNSSYIYENIKFIGCTLWTRSDPMAKTLMNDYGQIPNFNYQKCNQLHEEHIAYLKSALITDLKTVVITHHLPSYELINEKYKTIFYDKYNKYFATDLLDLINLSDYWICGHSHVAKQMVINKTKLYLNPLGYTNEKTGFNLDLLVDLEDKPHE